MPCEPFSFATFSSTWFAKEPPPNSIPTPVVSLARLASIRLPLEPSSWRPPLVEAQVVAAQDAVVGAAQADAGVRHEPRGVRDQLVAVGLRDKDARVAALGDLVAPDPVVVGALLDLDAAVAVLRHRVVEQRVLGGAQQLDAEVAAAAHAVALEPVVVRVAHPQARSSVAGRDAVGHQRAERPAHERDAVGVALEEARADLVALDLLLLVVVAEAAREQLDAGDLIVLHGEP
jgi:hypothetical protein